MKIVRRDFVPDGPGSVKIIPEEADDLWVAYNLIAEGDTVLAVTVRKVLREAASGGRDAERVKLKLEIKVENVEYDKEGSALRIRGKNILENEHVKIGAFHTLEIEQHRPFVLRKEVWDSLAREVLRQASDPSASADLAVVLMQEGLAHILLIGKSVTITRSRIETSIPRKHGPAIAGYDKALNKFFDNVLQAFIKHVDFKVVRCAVIASPGFTKDQFHRHLLLEAERKQLRPIIENKSRILLVHTTSGYKHSLKEVMDAPNVMNMIKDTKAAKEVQALKDFFNMLSNVRFYPWSQCSIYIFLNNFLDVSAFYLSYAKSTHRLFGFEFICLLFLVLYLLSWVLYEAREFQIKVEVFHMHDGYPCLRRSRWTNLKYFMVKNRRVVL